MNDKSYIAVYIEIYRNFIVVKFYILANCYEPYSVEVKYQDLEGKEHVKTMEGFEATVFSHEYDHLDGILHMDRSKEVYSMNREEMRAYRSSHPYEIISKE